MALVKFPSSAPVPPDPDDEELSDAAEEDGAGGKMSFLEHLDELRRRLIVSVWALVAGCVISFIFVGRLQEFIMLPLWQLMPDHERFIYSAPTEGFMIMMKIGALGGLFLALPVIVLQLWLFIAPGLYSNEKRFAVPFVIFGTLALHRVPVFLEVLPQLRNELSPVPAEHLLCVLALGEDAARLRRHLPDADDRVLSRQDGTRHRRVPHQAHEVRRPHHLYPRRRAEPRDRRRVAGVDGRTDARPLPVQHRHRVDVREEEA
jgi:Sec-independent protein translocase protein (TatC)